MSNFKGWILDALARESAHAINARVNIQYIPTSRREIQTINTFRAKYFPNARGNNLFFHHRTFFEVEKRVSLEESQNRIWLTHFEVDEEIQKLLRRDAIISKFFVQNTTLRDKMLESGFSKDKLHVTPGAVDRSRFFPSLISNHGENYFLFSGDCKPRKNPEFVEWIIRSFPELKFVIHGKYWESFNQGSLKNLPNLQIIEFDYSYQGDLLRGASALISVAQNEGGPISILEALASGTPVIATDTGFAKDLIKLNTGVLISEDLDLNGWRSRLNELIEIKKKVQGLDLLGGKFSWEKLGADFYH
jgi:glycosyltransferase involved in cell wall biosynthesis